MFLVCEVYSSAINVSSMRMLYNDSDVRAYLSNRGSNGARANGVTEYGIRVYFFDSPGAPAKRVTKDFIGLI